jgi:hypothetical protein
MPIVIISFHPHFMAHATSMMTTLTSKNRSRGFLGSGITALEKRLMLAADVGQVAAPVAETGASDCAVGSSPVLVFIDATIEGLDVLCEGLAPTSELVLLDPSRPLLQQINDNVVNRSGIAELHVVTHGEPGSLRLGSQLVDVGSLIALDGTLRNWRSHITGNADIILYGCNVGAGSAGNEFLVELAALTGADVAASTDRTGASRGNGDWEMEVAIGQVDATLAFSSDSQSRYRHTLDVTVTAFGSTGEEEFELLIDGDVVASWRATLEESEYTYVTDQALTPDRVAVRFVNDLYRPLENIDRNLVVDKVSIDGVIFESESDQTYSTGTYLAQDRITPGFGRGDTLHANGRFQYGGVTSSDLVEALGGQWSSTTGPMTLFAGDDQSLLVGPSAVPTVAWRFLDVKAGDAIEVNASAALVTSGAQPTDVSAVFGVDFYDRNGTKIGESIGTFSLNELGQQTTINGIAPEATVTSTAWIVLFPGSSGASATLEVSDFTVTSQPSSRDVTPPTATIVTPTITIKTSNPTPQTPLFTINLFDESGAAGIRVASRSFLVTSPSGQVSQGVIATGGDISEFVRSLGVAIPRTGSSFAAGEYTVSLSEGAVSDAAGNVAPTTTIGSFTVVLDDSPVTPNDTTAPTVRLTTSTVTSASNQFSVLASDTQSPLRFGGGDIQVLASDGRTVSVIGIAGGPGSTDRDLFQLFAINDTSITPGIYSVFANDRYVLDINNNANRRELIGTFEYISDVIALS